MCLSAVCSCVGSACVGCCCSSFSDCKQKHGPGSRIPYMFIMFLLCIFAVIMTLYGDTEIYENDLLNIDLVFCDPDDVDACQPNGSVYRVSFCLFLFFMIHAVIVKFVASFHWLFFGIKLFTLIGVLAVTYFIPNDPFEAYADFARIASIVFLLLQVIILIEWAWDVNDRVIAKVDAATENIDDDSEKRDKAELCCLKFGLVAATVIIYIGVIIFIVLMYGWFEPKKSCQFNSTILGITIVLVIVQSVLPVLLTTGSIFTTAVVSFYVTYLAFSGLENVPKEECNTFAQEESTTTMWVGIVVTTFAICYVGFSVSKNSSVLTGDDNNGATSSEINLELGAAPKKRGKDSGDDAGTAADSNYDDSADLGESNYDDAGDKTTTTARNVSDLQGDAATADQKANVKFHICMAFASIYMAMLYTNWGTNAAFNTDQSDTRSWESVWINIGAQWITIVLFIWTAVAPKVCPSRFGGPDEED